MAGAKTKAKAGPNDGLKWGEGVLVERANGRWGVVRLRGVVQMAPRRARDDGLYGVMTDPIFAGKHGVGHHTGNVPTTDLADLLRREPCRRVLGTQHSGVTDLLHPVHRVVFVGAEEEVVRSDASWIVATVADDQSVGNRSVRDAPRNAVCPKLSVPEPDRTVAPVLMARGPVPATVRRFLDVAPKSVQLIITERWYLMHAAPPNWCSSCPRTCSRTLRGFSRSLNYIDYLEESP